MKIIRYLSFFFITSLIFLIIFFSFFFDSKSLKNSIADNISKKISGDIKFDDKIDLTLFPNPKIALKNLSFFNKKLAVKVPNTQITSNWIFFLNGNFKFKNIEFLNPTINLNLETVDQSKVHNNYFLHVNLENNFKFLNNYLTAFEKIEMKNGIIKILTNLGEQNLEKVNLLFTNARKQIRSNFFFQKFQL